MKNVVIIILMNVFLLFFFYLPEIRLKDMTDGPEIALFRQIIFIFFIIRILKDIPN